MPDPRKDGSEYCAAEVPGHSTSRSLMQALLQRTIESAPLSSPVKLILFGPWLDVMVSTFVEEGADSRRMNHNLRFVKALLWSVQPKTTEAEQARLAETIPRMLTIFKRGLNQISYPYEKQRSLQKMLEVCHLLSMRGKMPSNAFTEAALSEILETENYRLLFQLAGLETQECTELSRDIINDDEEESIILTDSTLFDNSDALSVTPVDDEYTRQAAALRQGDWIEFYHHDRRVAGKVKSVSESQKTITIADRYNHFLTRKTVNGFAAELRRNSANVLKSPPLLDRFVQGMMKRIDKSR